MKRRLFKLAVGLSLLLCVATIAVWIRSYFVPPPPSTEAYSDRWLYDAGYAAIYKGEFTFVYYETEPRPARWFQTVTLNTPPFEVMQWMGGSGWNQSWWYTSVRVDFWLVAVCTLILPSVFITGVVRKRYRNQSGKCNACGYDLRATPDRRPECGTSQEAGAA